MSQDAHRLGPSTEGAARARVDPGRGRRRVAVAVEPRVLGDALATLLEEAGQDSVDLLQPGDAPEGRYDAAVVTLDLTNLDADLVIHLPDASGGAGIGTATAGAHDQPVVLADLRAVLQVLDDRWPTDRPRTAVLPAD